MKELQELAFVFNKHRIAKIEIIGDDSRRQDSKMYQLFEAVRAGDVKTDMEAANLLYGLPEISAKYRNLKSQLKKRLFNTVFFLDDGTNEREVAYYQCWKDWALCNILLHKDARMVGYQLADKIFKKALKYEFYQLIVVIALNLRSYYGRDQKDKKEFEYYNDIYYYHRKIEDALNIADEYYMRLILDYAAKGVVHDSKIKAASEAYYQELLPLTKDISSDRLHYRLIQIRLLGAMGTYDYRLAKEICEEGLARQRQSDNPFKGGIRNLLLNKLACHTQLKEYEAGRATALACEQLLKEGEFNWFKAKEYFFMLSMHIGAYQEAYETYEAITKHKRFKQFKQVFGETWVLYRQYLHFLVLSNKIVPAKGDKTYNNIRLGRFLNQVPSFSTDKQGMNIPVLIIQLAILILQQKYDAAEERIDALSKYLARYVKKSNPNYRCHHFIKLLMEVPTAGFQRKLIERKANKHLQKMQLVEMDFDSQSHEVEVLPFMRLWEMIVVLLK